MEKAGTLHAARLPSADGLLTTDRAVADERETLALMRAGQGRGDAPMRARAVDKALRNGPLSHGQKAAVKLILSAKDRRVLLHDVPVPGRLKQVLADVLHRGRQVEGRRRGHPLWRPGLTPLKSRDSGSFCQERRLAEWKDGMVAIEESGTAASCGGRMTMEGTWFLADPRGVGLRIRDARVR